MYSAALKSERGSAPEREDTRFRSLRLDSAILMRRLSPNVPLAALYIRRRLLLLLLLSGAVSSRSDVGQRGGDSFSLSPSLSLGLSMCFYLLRDARFATLLPSTASPSLCILLSNIACCPRECSHRIAR